MTVVQLKRHKPRAVTRKYGQPVPPIVRRAPEPPRQPLSDSTKAMLVALSVARTMKGTH